MFLLSVFSTALPILITNYALQLLGAARGGVIVSLQPVLTVLFSTLFFNETLSALQWVGGGLVVVAVVILQLSPDKGM
jgi:drug/metabolite transporter (DMT)-like permease